FGEEVLVGSNAAVAVRILDGLVAQIQQLLDDVVFARLDDAGRDGITIGMGVRSEMVEAFVSSARAFGGVRIDLVQIRDDRLDRRVETVKIEPVEADLALGMLVVPFTKQG